MAKIIWKKKWETLTEGLHSGMSVNDVATSLNISYSTLCKYLRTLSLDKHGNFKKPIKDTPNLQEYFTDFILKKYDQLQDICKEYGATSAQIEGLMKKYALTKEWALQDSTSENVAYGRRGELFIKEQPDFKIIADMIKKDSKAPYDLVLTPNHTIFNHWNDIDKLGAVDVKVTKLRKTNSGGYRHKFNIQNATAPTKYLFLLGYTENYEEPMCLYIIPFKRVKGKATLSISVDKLHESKYMEDLYKLYPSKSTNLFDQVVREKFNI